MKRQHKDPKPRSRGETNRHKPGRSGKRGETNRHKPGRSGKRGETNRHKPGRSGKSGERKTLFRNGQFVAWDGEGVTLTGGAALRAQYNARGIAAYERARATLPDSASARAELVALGYHVVTRGKGYLSMLDVDPIRERAGLVLALDEREGGSLSPSERILVLSLADDDDDIAFNAADALRDKRLSGALETRGQVRDSSEQFTYLADDEGAALLRENRPRSGGRGRGVPVASSPFDVTPPESIPVPEWHIYTSLAAAWEVDGDFIYRVLRNADGSRLTTNQILEFGYDVAADVGELAIHVGFYLSYDFTAWIYDLSQRDAALALVSSSKLWGTYEDDEVKLIPRKEFRARRRRSGDYWHVWDVAGFFQCSLPKAIRNWLGKDYPALGMIEAGKSERAAFASWDTADVDEYNKQELIALVRMLNKLRSAVAGAGYTLSRWDGAGALAASFYKRHMPPGWFKESRGLMPDEVLDAARYAYFGGRIEYIRYGVHKGAIWHGDINSAYPSAMATLPDFAAGRWQQVGEIPPERVKPFGVYHVLFGGAPYGIGVLPFRLERGEVLFPKQGEGYYWGVEVGAAARFLAEHGGGKNGVTILGGWEFVPENPEDKPFAWVAELYTLRQALVTLAKLGDAGAAGQQMVLKLGLNSLYGKTVQKLGYQALGERAVIRWRGHEEKLPEQATRESYPPFYNLAVGGIITATCRAALLDAARTNPSGVIAFATDGVFSSLPLTVNAPKEKILGAWEVVTDGDSLFVEVQPGVYYWRDSSGEWVEHCRGFAPVSRAWRTNEANQAALGERVKAIIAGYRRLHADKSASLLLPDSRFITVRQALAQDWTLRGQWVRDGRELALNNPSSKRQHHGDPAERKKSPAVNLVKTEPNSLYLFFDEWRISKPYDGLPPEGQSLIDDELELEAIADEFRERGIM